MIVRRAKFVDIPAIITLALEEYPKSLYAREGIEPSSFVFRRVVEAAMHSPMHQVWVLEGDKVEGILIAAMEPTYFADELFATDKFFLLSGAARGYGGKLFKAFMSWARQQPVAAIELTLTAGMPDQDRTAKLYERHGFVPVGHVYHLEVK